MTAETRNALIAALASALATGGGGALALRQPIKDEVRAVVRDEMAVQLKSYQTREDAMSMRDGERERLERKLDSLQTELIRLRIAVERMQR